MTSCIPSHVNDSSLCFSFKQTIKISNKSVFKSNVSVSG